MSILFLASLMEGKHAMLKAQHSEQGNNKLPSHLHKTYLLVKYKRKKKDGRLTRLLILENIQPFSYAMLHNTN